MFDVREKVHLIENINITHDQEEESNISRERSNADWSDWIALVLLNLLPSSNSRRPHLLLENFYTDIVNMHADNFNIFGIA